MTSPDAIRPRYDSFPNSNAGRARRNLGGEKKTVIILISNMEPLQCSSGSWTCSFCFACVHYWTLHRDRSNFAAKRLTLTSHYRSWWRQTPCWWDLEPIDRCYTVCRQQLFHEKHFFCDPSKMAKPFCLQEACVISK